MGKILVGRIFSAIGSQQLQHLRIAAGNVHAVAGGLHLGVGIGPAFEQHSGNFEMALARSCMQGTAPRGNTRFWRVGIGPACQQQFDRIDIAEGAGIAQGMARIVSRIGRDRCGQVGIGPQQLPHPFGVADFCRHCDVVVCSPGDEVADEHLVSRQCFRGHIAPAAEEIVAVAQIQGTGAVGAPGIDLAAPFDDQVDHCYGADHYGPMDRFVAAAIGRLD